MSTAAGLITAVGIILMFGGVFYNQATVWTATGWRYRVSVAAGFGGLFVVPVVIIVLAK
jgi:hypothetical protein